MVQRATKGALTNVHDELLCSVDKHGVDIFILLDLRPAFETIYQEVSLDRLKSLLEMNSVVLS